MFTFAWCCKADIAIVLNRRPMQYWLELKVLLLAVVCWRRRSNRVFCWYRNIAKRVIFYLGKNNHLAAVINRSCTWLECLYLELFALSSRNTRSSLRPGTESSGQVGVFILGIIVQLWATAASRWIMIVRFATAELYVIATALNVDFLLPCWKDTCSEL